jgi:flagellar basal-body rod modification protein FlgD
MTTPIGSLPTAPSQSVSTMFAEQAAAGASSTGTGALGQDTFLKLLVAQLQYQDPSQPADATQYLSETATFTQVQSLTQIDTKLNALLSAQQGATAAGLLGRTVTWTDTSTGQDVERTGVVTAVKSDASGPLLTVTPASGSPADIPLAGVESVTTTTS